MAVRESKREHWLHGALTGVLVIATLLVGAAPASAAVTLGRLPLSAPATSCSGPEADLIGSARLSNSPYLIRTDGTITSWRTWAGPGPGQIQALKVFRATDPSGVFNLVVAADFPRTLIPGAVNSFTTSIPVKTGDRIGLHDSVADSACVFPFTGARIQEREGNLLVGEGGSFTTLPDNLALNLAADVEPSNLLSIGRIQKDKKKGTAWVQVFVSGGEGSLTLQSKKIRQFGATKFETAGFAEIRVMAKKRYRRELNDEGKLKARFQFTYTPGGGMANTISGRLTLKKE